MTTTNRHLESLFRRGFDQSYLTDRRTLRPKCSQCEALVINDTACHERGCPNQPHACGECGEMHSTREQAFACCHPETV